MSAADVMRGTEIFRQMQERFGPQAGAAPDASESRDAKDEPQGAPDKDGARAENVARLTPPKG
jgi:hypothetical protein